VQHHPGKPTRRLAIVTINNPVSFLAVSFHIPEVSSGQEKTFQHKV
jgi:hypothetical protein